MIWPIIRYMSTPNIPWTLALNSGGCGSLLATALAPRDKLALLFIHDGSPASRMRQRAFHQQADHFQIQKRIELMMPHVGLIPSSVSNDPTAQPYRMPFALLQMLTAALGQAIGLKAKTLIWPIQVCGEFHNAAKVIETLQLLQQIIGLDYTGELLAQTPLLELTDRQILETGHQMDLPWQLTRSCDQAEEVPCGNCHGCHRRIAAFAAAGMDDPIQLTPAGR